jgi:hypothetical protein
VDSKPALRGSNIPAIQLWQKPCWANLFDGQVAAGPIPILLSQFAEDPVLIQVAIVSALFSPSPPLSQIFSIAQMDLESFPSHISNTFLLLCTLSFCLSQADPAGFHSELQRLATCFFKPEAISWKEALSLAKRPRGGKGAAAFIRKRPASTLASGPAAKRPKTANSTTGRLTYLFSAVVCLHTGSVFGYLF